MKNQLSPVHGSVSEASPCTADRSGRLDAKAAVSDRCSCLLRAQIGGVNPSALHPTGLGGAGSSAFPCTRRGNSAVSERSLGFGWVPVTQRAASRLPLQLRRLLFLSVRQRLLRWLCGSVVRAETSCITVPTSHLGPVIARREPLRPGAVLAPRLIRAMWTQLSSGSCPSATVPRVALTVFPNVTCVCPRI